MKKSVIIIICLAFLAFGLAWLVACDLEDEVKDEVADQADNDFDENEVIELDPIIYDVETQASALDIECGTTSANAELDRIGVDQDQLDIDGIDLRFVEARYRNASWTPAEITEMTCSVTFGGETTGMVTVWELAVNNGGSTWEKIDVSDQAAAAITYYLNHRNEQFSYCAICDDDPDSAYVEFELNLGVTVHGEVIID